MENILELGTRKEIFESISAHPGIHLSKIAELLNLRTSLAEYHLLFLIKNDVIYVDKSTGYNQYYVKGTVGTFDKKMLSLLRRKHILEIVLFLLHHEYVHHKQILKQVDISASTLSYHLDKLVKNDMVEVHSRGKEKGYKLKDKEMILRILLQYKPFDLLEGFQDIWSDLSI